MCISTVLLFANSQLSEEVHNWYFLSCGLLSPRSPKEHHVWWDLRCSAALQGGDATLHLGLLSIGILEVSTWDGFPVAELAKSVIRLLVGHRCLLGCAEVHNRGCHGADRLAKSGRFAADLLQPVARAIFLGNDAHDRLGFCSGGWLEGVEKVVTSEVYVQFLRIERLNLTLVLLSGERYASEGWGVSWCLSGWSHDFLS